MTEPNQKTLAAEQAKKSVLVSIFVNIFLASLQIVIGLFAHSQALFADGLHSLSDLVCDFLALIAAHFSHKPADKEHPYGHYRYENAASLALGILLMLTGIAMIHAAVDKLKMPHHSVHISAIFIAILALITKEALFRYMLKAAKKARSAMLITNAWHARSDAASSLVAVIGTTGAVMGIEWLDPVAALLVGAMIMSMACKFSWQALQSLIDASADEQTLKQIENTINNQSGVLGFHQLRSRKAGNDVFIDLHIEVYAYLSVLEGHEIAKNLRLALLEIENVADVLIHVDPVTNKP